MKIIIPNNNKDNILKNIKNNNCEILDHICILSPFMYMNYNDAVKKTVDLLTEFYNKDIFIVDYTGLTIHVLKQYAGLLPLLFYQFTIKFIERFNIVNEYILGNITNALCGTIITEYINEEKSIQGVALCFNDTIKEIRYSSKNHKCYKIDIIKIGTMFCKVFEERENEYLLINPIYDNIIVKTKNTDDYT